MAVEMHATLEKALRIASNSQNLVQNFNQRSDCYEKEGQKNDLSMKITASELEIIEKELLQHLPHEKVEKLLLNIFLKLTNGTIASDHSDAYVSMLTCANYSFNRSYECYSITAYNS